MTDRGMNLALAFSVCLAIASGAPTAAPANSTVASTPPLPADIGIPPPGAPNENSCSDKKPCPDKNSKCIDGNCLCNEGFAPVGNNSCLKAPVLGETCRQGSTELSCSGFGVDFICPPNGTVCQCRPGYEPDGKIKCKAAIRNVGAKCTIDGDCTAAFTTCQSGKCACIEGFKADAKGTYCTPTAYNCLNGDKALEEKGGVRLCEVTVNPESGDIANDTCPSDHFCNTWQNSQSATRSAPGHCCPKPSATKNVTATCPVGVEHKTGKCPDLSLLPADAPLPADIGPLCPLGGGYECFHGRLCCPLACRSSNGFFNVAGRCYDSVILDDPCELDVQCLPGATCTKGICQCKKGYTKATPTLCLAPGEPNPFATPVP